MGQFLDMTTGLSQNLKVDIPEFKERESGFPEGGDQVETGSLGPGPHAIKLEW